MRPPPARDACARAALPCWGRCKPGELVPELHEPVRPDSLMVWPCGSTFRIQGRERDRPLRRCWKDSIGIRPNLSQGGQRYPEMLDDLGRLDPGHQRRSDRVALGLGHLVTF